MRKCLYRTNDMVCNSKYHGNLSCGNKQQQITRLYTVVPSSFFSTSFALRALGGQCGMDV
jgi:hypothetical protein